MVKTDMPSTVGHALAGVAVAWTADLLPGNRPYRPRPASAAERASGPLTLVCAVLAALPDADLLFGVHRTATHSVGALALVIIVAAAVTERVTRQAERQPETDSLAGRSVLR